MKIRVILTLVDRKETSVVVGMARGSSVYATVMQAKAQGLEIPQRRNVTYLRHKMPNEKEEDVKILEDGDVCVSIRDGESETVSLDA